MSLGNLMGAGMFSGLLAAGMTVMVVGLVFYLYISFALMTMAKKKNVENGWLAFIPIANLYIMSQVAGLEWYWMLGFLLGIVPSLGSILTLVWMVYLWWKIAEALNKPGWYALLMLIPFVNLVIIYMLAWGK